MVRRAGPQMTSVQSLPDEAFLDLFDLPELTEHLATHDLRGAKIALLDHIRDRVNQVWLEPPQTITDISLELGELSRDALIERADKILAYQFAPEPAPPTIRQGGMLDWRANPSNDKEWLWTLNRQAWWAVLSLAYIQTGNERYAAAFVSQMLDWVDNCPPIPFKDEQHPHWRLMDAGVRMRVSWIPAFGAFYESPAFTDEAKLTMLRAIYDHARFLLLFKN